VRQNPYLEVKVQWMSRPFALVRQCPVSL